MYRVGISGWTYPPWRGVFYPKDLAHRLELEYASRQFNSIEINGTFYSLQRPKSFQEWAARTPDDFVFSVKGGRFITHMRKLKDIETPLANFFASGLLCLGVKLGPILWQFPPNFGYDHDRFSTFFQLLPRDTKAAARLARRHDEKLRGRAWLDPLVDIPLRHCVEIRHESFRTPEFFRLLKREKIAFVFADSAGKWPYAEDLTSDFAYIRLHGAEELYASGYTPDALDWWAARLRAWAGGTSPAEPSLVLPQSVRPKKARDVFIYFDNDAKVKAPFDAKALCHRLEKD